MMAQTETYRQSEIPWIFKRQTGLPRKKEEKMDCRHFERIGRRFLYGVGLVAAEKVGIAVNLFWKAVFEVVR
jgi:hypothetical protein